MSMLDDAIREVEVSNIHPDPTNLKTHTEANIAHIVASIQRFGFADPLGVVEHPDPVIGGYMVVEGHGRLEAAQRLRIHVVPVIVLDLDEAARRGYGIAHNQIQQITGMDMAAVSGEFQRLGVNEGDHISLGFSDEDVLFMPSGISTTTITSGEGDQFSAPGGGDYEEGDIGVGGAGAIRGFVPVVHRSTLRFASDLSYNRFLVLLGHVRDRHPLSANISERVLLLLKDLGFNGETTADAEPS